MPTFRPRSAPVEAFQFRPGMSHPRLTRTPQIGDEGDYPNSMVIGGGPAVLTAPQSLQEVVKGDYVILLPNGFCKVVPQQLFEAIYDIDGE